LSIVCCFKESTIGMAESEKRTRWQVLTRVWRLIGRIFTEYVIWQLVSTLPLAYLLALLQTFLSGAPVVFDSIPLWTYPILAFLVLVVVSKPAFIDPCLEFHQRKLQEKREARARRKERLRQYARSIDSIANYLDQLDQLHLSPVDRTKLSIKVKQQGDRLLPTLKHFRGSLETPGPIKINNYQSRQQWAACLRDERMRTAESLIFGRGIQEIDGFIEVPTFTEDDDVPF